MSPNVHRGTSGAVAVAAVATAAVALSAAPAAALTPPPPPPMLQPPTLYLLPPGGPELQLGTSGGCWAGGCVRIEAALAGPVAPAALKTPTTVRLRSGDAALQNLTVTYGAQQPATVTRRDPWLWNVTLPRLDSPQVLAITTDAGTRGRWNYSYGFDQPLRVVSATRAGRTVTVVAHGVPAGTLAAYVSANGRRRSPVASAPSDWQRDTTLTIRSKKPLAAGATVVVVLKPQAGGRAPRVTVTPTTAAAG